MKELFSGLGWAMLICLCFPVEMYAQNKYTISGSMKDKSSGEDLLGATVTVKELPGTGTATNEYGFYSLTIPEGSYTLVYSYIGYADSTRQVSLTENLKINIELDPSGELLEEVTVNAKKENDEIVRNEMSVVQLSPKEIESVPVLFGEKDIIKVAQLTPGVKSAGEGNSGFFVRGGAADQNLILLDEAPVYNASHLFGFFSVFNSDAIKDVKLYKGGISPEYGGRASSVMDIKMNDGNNKKFGAQGGIGLISSKLTVEGPIVKNKGSFIVSGRRTYADLFAKLSKKKNIRNVALYFYDLTAKANYQITEKDRIFLSGYLGRDKLGFSNEFGFDWGNKTGTLRWNHIFGDRLFANTSIIFSDYNYKIQFKESKTTYSISSLIRDMNGKLDFSYYVNDKWDMKFGGNTIYHKFLPGEFKTNAVKTLKVDEKHAGESALYFQSSHDFSNRLSLTWGARYSFFNYMGPSPKFTFDEKGKILEKKSYKKWQNIQLYHGLEPRVNAKFQLNDRSAFKASFNRNYQYLHLLSNSTSAQPNDVWVPSSNNIKPLIADQVAIGYFINLKDNQYKVSVESYYKLMKNQLDYKDGADIFLNETVENQLLYGKGRAYGVEFMLKKSKGAFTGWLGYTWARSLKQIPGINLGKEYPAKQDRIHDISIVGMYKFSDRLKLAANWVFYTGNAVTFPSAKYTINDVTLPYYTERNGYRMPNYHRLDLGLTLDNRPRKNFRSSWNFSIYNAYARSNAYTITFRPKADDPNQTEAVRTTLFRIVPSVSYNFKF